MNTPPTQGRAAAGDQDLLAAAAGLHDALAAAAAGHERQRRLSPETTALLADAGFFRLFVPQALGGLETSPVTALRIFERLAMADAASAWVTFIGATSGSTLAALPTDAASAIFADPTTLVAGVFAPMGTAEQQGDHFVVNGRWQWGSGTERADWILGGCRLLADGAPLTTDSGAPRNHMLLFPAGAVQFHDTWHSNGLRGTGSTDFSVSNLRVPAAHAVGWQVPDLPPRPLYRFPQFTLLAVGIAGVALGIARAAITDLVALAAGKHRAGSSASLAERSHSQVTVARAEASLRGARAGLYEALQAAWAAASGGQAVTVELRRDVRLATTHAMEQAMAVVDAMYTLAGGAAVFDSSPLQRHLRDVHTASQHIMVGPHTWETAGRLFLGQPANTATL